MSDRKRDRERERGRETERWRDEETEKINTEQLKEKKQRTINQFARAALATRNEKKSV